MVSPFQDYFIIHKNGFFANENMILGVGSCSWASRSAGPDVPADNAAAVAGASLDLANRSGPFQTTGLADFWGHGLVRPPSSRPDPAAQAGHGPRRFSQTAAHSSARRTRRLAPLSGVPFEQRI